MTIAITALLSLIEQLLPLLGTGANVVLVDSILNALTQFLPFIVNEIASLYQPVKNIIAALSASPAANADQLATLQVLDKQVDAAFDAIASQTDSDGTAPA
jgi:hypothetical protein